MVGEGEGHQQARLHVRAQGRHRGGGEARRPHRRLGHTRPDRGRVRRVLQQDRGSRTRRPEEALHLKVR